MNNCQMKHHSRRKKSRFFVLFILFAWIVSFSMESISADEVMNENEEKPMVEKSKRPRHGDKLGYSKEESIRRLDPQVRELLDILLRMYQEPGLFTNRLNALEALGVNNTTREWMLRNEYMPEQERTHFKDYFAPEGFFAREGWSGYFFYDGWRGKGKAWFAVIHIMIDRKIECIDSRAVEGYLDLFLQTGLAKRTEPVPEELWNRHGLYGTPYALETNPQLPGFGLVFSHGCLIEINLGGSFDYSEISDDNI